MTSEERDAEMERMFINGASFVEISKRFNAGTAATVRRKLIQRGVVFEGQSTPFEYAKANWQRAVSGARAALDAMSGERA